MATLFSRSEKAQAARKRFRSSLLRWYNVNKRDLPWRCTRDPFHIWVSEIMLQQTRVAAVLGHYKRFFQQFPTVFALAKAREQQVLTAWSGLGYYRRARMLHRAAKEVVRKHAGRIPDTAAELKALPGIGRYTASAIASIAFQEPVAVVDGNVERVLSRIGGKELTTSAYWEEAEKLVYQQRPGDFNQAMMELGATICLPKFPSCSGCPVTGYCATQGAVQSKRPKMKQNQRQRDLGFITRKNAVFLQQRSDKESVMPGMWELPEYRGSQTKPLFRVKHSIMNTDYEVRVFAGQSDPQIPAQLAGFSDLQATKWVSLSRLKSVPLTGMSRKVLRKLGLLQ